MEFPIKDKPKEKKEKKEKNKTKQQKTPSRDRDRKDEQIMKFICGVWVRFQKQME